MTTIEFFKNQLEQEAPVTRKMLQLVPDDQYQWQPHPKSMTLIRLATHVAEVSGWVEMAVDHEELDFGNGPFEPEPISNNAELLKYFEGNLKAGLESLENGNEDELNNIWVMRAGDQEFLKDTKREVVRMCLSQLIHHRAQLGVYLRLLNIPIPGSYGPSADEMEMYAAAQ